MTRLLALAAATASALFGTASRTRSTISPASTRTPSLAASLKMPGRSTERVRRSTNLRRQLAAATSRELVDSGVTSGAALATNKPTARTKATALHNMLRDIE